MGLKSDFWGEKWPWLSKAFILIFFQERNQRRNEKRDARQYGGEAQQYNSETWQYHCEGRQYDGEAQQYDGEAWQIYAGWKTAYYTGTRR